MLSVGLTGGIASGKSTAAALLAKKGALLLDFDELVRRVQQRGSPVWQAIVENFGQGILRPDGQLDRPALAEVIFSDEKKRRLLEGLVHPAVIALWQDLMAGLAAPGRIVLTDCPLLFEAGLKDLFDLVLVVHLSPQEQIKRLMERDKLSLPAARARLNAQMPIEEKLSLAHIVVDNSGTVADLNARLDEVWERLQKEEARRRGRRA